MSILFCNLQAHAQTLDSILVFRDVQPDFSLDGYNTRVLGHPVTLSGVRGGIAWQRKYRAGLGYYFMASRPYETVNLDGKEVSARLRFRYVSVYGEYTFFESRKWKLNAGLRPGFGQLAHRYVPPVGEPVVFNRRYFPLLEPYVSGSYRIIPELGLSGGLGYRAAAAKGVSYGWVSLGIAVFWNEVWERGKGMLK